jgi:hypothetical protein
MTKAYLYLYLAVLVTANLVFGFIIPLGRDEQLASSASNEWKIAEPTKAVAVDLKQLTASGFWGDVSQSDNQGAESSTQKEVNAQEAKKLRVQIKAIINNKQTKEVLFGVNKNYQRTQQGQTLPGTSWVLLEIGEDWLKLSKDGKPENAELLKLFTSQKSAEKVK